MTNNIDVRRANAHQRLGWEGDAMVITKIADAVRVVYCKNCDTFHLFLFSREEDEPFAAASLTSGTICDLIDADVGERVELHPQPSKMLPQ